MNVEPASINQIRVANDGRVYELDADASTVAGDLAALDRGLKVRFSERGECWIIYHQHHSGCPHNGSGGPGSEYLVRSVQAYQGSTGVWTGLDQRIVERMRYVNPEGRSGYDYAREVEAATLDAYRRRRQGFAEKVGDAAERTAHALRKDLGERYRGRVFVPRAVD